MSYPGGKNGNGVYQRLINMIPPHAVYVEPFLGAGAIMLAKRPAKVNIGLDKDAQVVEMWKKKRGVLVYEGDAMEWLERGMMRLLRLEKADTFIYVDPPYLPETLRTYPRYKYNMTAEEHERLLRLIVELPCMVMISGYISRMYSEYLHNWEMDQYTAVTRGGPVVETCWMNYPKPEVLHEYTYAGGNYRERERILKKKKRWCRKLRAMPAMERNAIMDALGVVVAEATM